eukprot:CAMPEP_0117542592 /NCGR_PEP_ID=MMETSP0784-20121206/44625_1 /TAXON_ID=39447 /ORGANISM="" /LENGTH=325 /DNA_ID=CAMNT_0005339345 /DNA_START=15 /DNA_END=989 /DNA_ORIENTATION=+
MAKRAAVAAADGDKEGAPVAKKARRIKKKPKTAATVAEAAQNSGTTRVLEEGDDEESDAPAFKPSAPRTNKLKKATLKKKQRKPAAARISEDGDNGDSDAPASLPGPAVELAKAAGGKKLKRKRKGLKSEGLIEGDDDRATSSPKEADKETITEANGLNDISIDCMDCKKPFAFTAGEQEFFAQRGLNERPKRCQTCIWERKMFKSGRGHLIGKGKDGKGGDENKGSGKGSDGWSKDGGKGKDDSSNGGKGKGDKGGKGGKGGKGKGDKDGTDGKEAKAAAPPAASSKKATAASESRAGFLIRERGLGAQMPCCISDRISLTGLG